MPACIHCGHDVGYSANFCPNCGESNPSDWDQNSSKGSFTDFLPIKDEAVFNVSKVVGIVGAIGGLVWGASIGFSIGGMGGALLFGMVGTGLGLALGFVIPGLAITLLDLGIRIVVVVVPIVFLVWLLTHLWGVR